MKSLLLGLVRAYQWLISPMMGPTCRFYPTCSNYALEAIRVHGAWKGFLLALVRVSKCHPWHAGGADLVPPPTAEAAKPASVHGQASGCTCKHS